MPKSSKTASGAYQRELLDTLQKLREDAPPIVEIETLMQTVQSCFNLDQLRQRKPQVIVLGSCIPEELIYAAGAKPHWVLGGSLGAAEWADDLVPRDTDPVSRSMLGFLQNDLVDLAENALVLIPTVNDSCRKLAYLLRRAGKKVHTIDVPPIKGETAASREWERQLEQCAEALTAHTGKRITGRSFQKASHLVAGARLQMQQFLQLTHEKPPILSGALRMFLLQSYYHTDDLAQWTAHLSRLNAKLERADARNTASGKANVLLLGSPVYFPNYKIPFLLQDVGLNICEQIDYTTQKVYLASSLQRINPISFPVLADFFYKRDCSSAYPQNGSLFQSIHRLIAHTNRIDGVVYHVLKGQIEYDFELERMEDLCSHHGIPVFRLETDYKYQDVEQLRIRMEAFTEMLTQRRLRKDRYAV